MEWVVAYALCVPILSTVFTARHNRRDASFERYSKRYFCLPGDVLGMIENTIVVCARKFAAGRQKRKRDVGKSVVQVNFSTDDEALISTNEDRKSMPCRVSFVSIIRSNNCVYTSAFRMLTFTIYWRLFAVLEQLPHSCDRYVRGVAKKYHERKEHWRRWFRISLDGFVLYFYITCTSQYFFLNIYI